MPFNAEQLAYAGRIALDYFLKNDPIDQINVAHPLLKKLTEGKKDWTGGLQYVVEQLRYQNDSNFQAYFGDGEVTYNRKRSVQQAKYTWSAFHDGFGLNEDELAQNGVTMTDDRGATPTDNEKIQLTNLLEENMRTLKLGFEANFDAMIHRNGAQSSLDIPGLDALISLSPTAGTIGGLAASNSWWQNYANTAVEDSSEGILEAMEVAWRACIRYGGKVPNFILVGSNWVDAYRDACVGGSSASIRRTLPVSASGGNRKGVTADGSVGDGISTGLYFKGIELIWDPVFDQLDTEDSPTVSWADRCYFINTEFLTLRPIAGHWMVPRKPPRVYNRYVHYWGLTAKAALTTSKRNAHAVLALG